MTRLRTFLLLACAVVAGALLSEVRSAVAFPILDPGQGVAQGSGYPAFGTDTVTAVAQGGALIGPLAAGLYAFNASTTCFADQGASTVTTSLITDRRIPAGYVYPLRVDGVSDTYVAVMCTASTMVHISKDSYR